MKYDVPPKYRKLYARAIAGLASPRAAIKLHCIHCCGWQRAEAVACTATGCPLFRYRPGAAPNRRQKRLAGRGCTQPANPATKTGGTA